MFNLENAVVPMLSFTKTKTTTYTPEWINYDFMEFGYYKSVRNKSSQYIQDSCFKCGGKFRNDQQMSLVSLGMHGNKLFCLDCANSLTEKEDKEDV